MHLSSLYKHLKAALGNESEARLIIEQRAGYEWADIIARPDSGVDAARLAHIESDVARRLAGEPLSRIYGVREFWGLSFALSPDTLDPRPDTETLVEAALEAFRSHPPETILDLGTGTGCILISLLHEWKTARGTGTDLSAEALKTARKNAQTHGVANRSVFICGSWAQALEEKFDLVVSNPPYISNQIIPTLALEVRNHDPILALDGGENGLQAYEEIFSQLARLLKPGGKAFFEIGFDQEKNAVRLAEDSGLFVKRVHRDLAGNPRVVEISSGDK